MPKRGKKGNSKSEKRATPAPSPPRLLSYLAEHAGRISVCLVLLASARIVATYSVFNHMIDEPAHIACGMEWLDRHTYQLEQHHPPLARVAVALGPYLAGARTQGGKAFYQDNPFHAGGLILYTGGHYQLYLTLARVAVLPFFWIAAWGVYWWARKYFDGLVACLAVFLFTFLPPILAHSGVATNDMALTAFVGLSFILMLEWLERPSVTRSVFFGLGVGLAVLSKFTAFLFIPVTILAALLWYLLSQRPALAELWMRLRELALPFGLAVLTGALTIWAMYRFSFGPAPYFRFPVPAPQLFGGIQELGGLNEHGYPAYLLGQHNQTGWWYYYLVILGVKTPLAFLGLLGVGVFISIRRRIQSFAAYVLPLAFSGALLIASFFIHINTGVRYLLPIYVGFSITAALGLAELLRAPYSRRWLVRGCWLAVAWFSLSSLLHHPDYIAYYNELVGDEPERVIADSDLDWGQDMNRAGKRLQELGVRQVAFTPFILADLRQHGWPLITESDPQTPSPGWNAVSITVWKVARMGLMDQYPGIQLWPDVVKPRERIGKGMLLYYFPPGRPWQSVLPR